MKQAQLNNIQIIHIYKYVEIDTKSVLKNFCHRHINKTRAIVIRK